MRYFTIRHPHIVLAAGMLLCLAAPGPGAENLLRNGSFEGGLLYWHNIDPASQKLVRGGAAAGEYALRVEKGNPMSAPFACEVGQEYTITFSARGDKEGLLHVQMPPSAREVGQKAGRLWTAAATRSVKIGPEWRRLSVAFKADVPQDGFWVHPHYLVQFEGTVPLLLDAVTVTKGGDATPAYVPRRALEVLAECPDLPGYEGHGNLLDKGATVRLVAHASNPGGEAREVTVRWQFIDYEGVRPLAEAVERKLAIPAGKTASETISARLPATGTVLARISAWADGEELDRSDLPLTSLPYPTGPRKPDPAERFGGSFFGPGNAALGSRLGFAWSRWYPHTKWQDHQPQGPDAFHWFDKELDILEGMGISSHLVLYGWPKWAMDDQHPLPKDMRWKADDPRWDDLTVATSWDKYMKAVAAHYKGRAVVYEIENEPEFDKWDKLQDEYAKFTIRSAKLLKQADPSARVMVNNVYGIPDGLNRRLLEKGGAKVIDIISWHDYHEGWLADAAAMRRMRAALDDLGGKHIEIWFNEGWAYTNTAVDEPIACTRLTSAQSTNAMVDSIAELTAAGQDKTILFHTGYEKHGMSFWDYSGPGTMLWDWYSLPMPLVAAWNTLAHHVGKSDRVALVRPPGATFCVFQDLRNRRGVMVAYADREAPSDVTVELPLDGLIAEDAMGNAAAMPATKLVLSKTGRPVFLYDAKGTAGQVFAQKLEPLDRRHAGFVSSGGQSWALPSVWEGKTKGSAEGNPALADGKPVWRLDQVWPPDPKVAANYHAMVWRDGWWVPAANAFGDQPKAEMKGRGIRVEFRAKHGNPPAGRICGLTFIVPRDGSYRVGGSAELNVWEGDVAVCLAFLHKTAVGAKELATLKLEKGKRVALAGFAAHAKAGDELVLLPRPDGAFVGGDVTLRDIEVGPGSDTAAAGGVTWRLPQSWEGTERGRPDGNPVLADGKPVWRLDQLWPADPIIAANYRPMVWMGSQWGVTEHGQGGHPSASVRDGAFTAGSLGAWTGQEYQKTGGLVFIAPKSGLFRVTGQARTKPWEGGAKVYRLGIYKKDTQRAASVKVLELPREGTPVAFDLHVELTTGHELVFLPLMPDWNNATTTTIANLAITAATGVTSAPAEPRAPAGPNAAADGPSLPPDGAYCRVDADGHLSIGGQRVRFWGAIGSFPDKQETIKDDPYYRQREAVRRVQKVGFNMIRIWHLEFDDDAKKGDLSRTDVSDRFLAECGKQGVRLWAAGFGGGALYEDDVEAGARAIDEPTTAAEWAAAVKSMCGKDWWTNNRKAMSLLTVAVAWDGRLEKLAIEQMRRKALHVNLHTGLRHADDPAIAIWELTNEQWWMSNMFSGQWQRLPAFFRRELLDRWSAWLTEKYATQVALTKAWGFLFPGEDLAKGTVLLAPMAKATSAAEMNDTNPAALEAFRTIASPIGRDECTTARGNDVIEFLLEVIVSHKQRWAGALKTWGKSCRLSPLIYDTGIGQSIQAQYLQVHADAVAHASYMEGIELDRTHRTHKRWPFYSGLDLPPQMCKDVPWLEHNRPVGKPFLCYETQFGSPSKYRAEWPVRIAALGSIQDWDAACYHYWSFGQYDLTKPAPYGGALAQPGPGAYQYDYTSDEVEQASMRAAGAVFRGGLVAAAPKPTLFTFGRPALLDPRSMDYAGDYGRTGLMDMMTTTYVNGTRLAIDPRQQEFVKTDGPVTRFNGFERPAPLRPSPQVEFDYQRACVTMDSPAAACYTGFLGQYGAAAVKFAGSGVELSDVVHADPPATPFPSGTERFASFTLASEDGKPLAACRRAVLVLVASSFNTGLAVMPKPGGGFDVNWGRQPVLVTRVGAKVTAVGIAGMKYRMIDFNERVLVEGTVGADGVLAVPADKPVWVTELDRP